MEMIHPLDLILFGSRDPISKTIQLMESIWYKDHRFSHVGIIVTSDVLPSLTFLIPGRLYILESNFTYGYSPDVESGYGKIGVQIRDLAHVLKDYTKEDRIVWLSLKDNPWNKYRSMCIQVMENIWKKYRNKGLDLNPIDLLSSVSPFFAMYRDDDIDDEVFCSEFVTLIYQCLGVLPKGIDPRDISPMDFLFLSAKNPYKGYLPIQLQSISLFDTPRNIYL